jgi:DNA-binding CsgD family transcriptional regulator
LSDNLRDGSLIKIEAYDITILKLLSKGLIIDKISQELKYSCLVHNGINSIVKRINKLKIYLKANNNVHLIAISKDLEII